MAESGRVALKWGDEIGKHGNDIITVHTKTGAVEFWGSKFRSHPTTGKTSPTYTNKGRLENAKTEALEYIEASNLPPEIKIKASQNVRNDNFTMYTVGNGKVDRSIIDYPNSSTNNRK